MTVGREFRYVGRVAWSDTDTAGVAFFGIYCNWVEYAEAEMWRDAGLPMGEIFERHNLWIPRVDFRCRYRRPLRYDEASAFDVAMRIRAFDGRSITYAFEVVRGEQGDVSARGELRIAAVDRSSFEGREFPDEIVDGFTKAGYLDF